MKKTKKRFLALMLALTMVMSMGTQTFAAGTGSESDVQTQDIQTETETGTEDNTADVPDNGEEQEETEKTTDVTSDGTSEETSDEAVLSDDTGVSVQSNGSEPAVQSNVTDKPSDGTTSGQPFAAGTAGSQYFRIPAMVTLDNGTIVAAADARWDTTRDAGGLDTIVARSSDNGANWNYTFANYLGDNGNTHNTASTTFIDPALATDGSTIYMLVDLFPGGVALNSSNQEPEAAAAFDDAGRLKLAERDSEDYSYYLGAFADGSAQIYNADGTAVDGYTVDEYFNLYQGDTKVSNLFFSDALYRVVKTSYLYLTKSTDGGATWSAPTLLDLKEDDEQFYGVGPGTGIVTSTGRIIFAAYSHNSSGILGLSSTEYTSVIYSDNGGQSWTRSADMKAQSSEATLVEADGRIYMFTRHGGYYVSTDNGTTWSEKQDVTGISYDTECQLNAMVYSEKIDGKTAILLSAPADDRTKGRIFVGLVQEDGSISWVYTYIINNTTYQYSCLTEQNDGSVGLLYENDSASIQYTNIPIEELAKGAQIGDPDPGFVAEDGSLLTNLNFAATDEAKTVSFRGLSEGQSLSVTTSAEDVATAETDGSSVTITPVGKGTAIITATVQSSSRSVETGVKFELTVNVSGVDEAYTGKITENPGRTRYMLDTDGIENGNYLIVYEGHALQNNNGETSTGDRDVTVNGNEVVGIGDDTYVLWTFTGSGNQFTIQNTRAYLYLHSSKTLEESSQICTLDGSNGNYKIYGSNQYLHWTNGFWGIGAGFEPSTNATEVSLYLKTTENSTWSTDLSKLQAQIVAANALAENDYTSESWKVLQEAVKAAESFTSSEYSSKEEAQTAQNEIDKAAQTIADAIEALQPMPFTEELTVAVGQSLSVPVEGTMTQEPDEQIATAEIVDGTMTITGVAVGTTTIVVGIGTYHITVTDELDLTTTPFVAGTGQGTGKAVTKLTTSVGVTFDLNISDAFRGQDVEWSTEDSSIATVDQNGTVTGRTVGDTNLIATIDGVQYKIPVTVLQGGGNDWSHKMMNIYISEITDSTVYYSENCGTDMVEVREGEAIYVRYAANSDVAMDFFAKPNQGYALTRMSATNSAGDYYVLHTGNHETIEDGDTGFLNGPGGAGVNQQTAFGENAVRQMLSAAIAAGCDGGLGFTRNRDQTGDVNSDLTFRSEKLPEVKKEVAGILGTSGQASDYREYEEGMSAVEGETVYFRITVTKAQYQDSIDFTNPILTEELQNAYFTNSYGADQGTSQNLGNILDTTGSVSETYYVGYKITQGDLDTTITNTVNLSYTYQAEYSTGAFDTSAEAEAVISAVSFEPEDIVIDFGLPVELNFSAEDAHGKYDLASGTAVYGDVTVKDNIVTYTPDRTLLKADTVTLTNTAGGTYRFTVYPATSVYYEEGFASYIGSWSVADSAANNQTVSIANDETVDLYGYDTLYASATGNSNNTVKASSTKNDTATFTFNGTGLDIYALTTQSSGSMSLWLYEGEGTGGTLLKLGYVDTANNWLEGNTGNYYNTPVFSYKDLEVGTYTVKIIVNSGTISLDGFRVYNTQGNAYESVYAADQEDQAVVSEVRDITIAGSTYDPADIDDWYKYGTNIIDAVYDESNDGSGAVILEKGEGITANADMINNGPKNEIYLTQGQTIAMRLTASAYDKVAVGMRSLNGGTVSYQINDQSGSVSSTVDMYYEVQPNNDMIVIENKGDNVLALTKIKVTGAANGVSGMSLFSMDADTMAFALQCIADATEPVETADAALTVSVIDNNGSAVAETVLTANGTVGETHTFAAEDIQAAAEGILPEGYELTGEAADVEVAYGESGTTELTAEQAEADEPADGPEQEEGFFEKLGHAVQEVVNTVVDAVTGFFRSIFGW